MKSIFFTIAIAISSVIMANNISITDISLTGINTTNKTVQVRFSVSWENSWRTSVGPANWDAAWIFVKFRRGGVGDWKHARLNNAGHFAATGSIITTGLQTPSAAFNTTTNPGIGAFVHRSANGSGTFTCNNMQLQWNYGANGVTNTDLVEVQVYAIEMVHVPQGEFAVGDTAALLSAIHRIFPLTTINTSNALADPSGTGSLGGNAGGYATGRNSTTEYKPTFASYPNGYNAFYCMKYEITQKGYVDFLNSLSAAAQRGLVKGNLQLANITKRYILTDTTLVFLRNGVAAPAKGFSADNQEALVFGCDLNGNGTMNEADDGLDLACNFLSKKMVFAYLCWAGLRPMTDMEFIKSCRGTLPMVTREFAWGSASGIQTGTQSAALLNAGTAQETAGNTNANYSNSASYGPTRVGMFARANTNRLRAGATYYGILDMTGNIPETMVTLVYGPFRGFQGTHGSGMLDVNGRALNTDWSIVDNTIGQNARDRTIVEFWWTNSCDGGRGVRNL